MYSFLSHSPKHLENKHEAKPIIIWDGGGVIVDFNPKAMAKNFAEGKYEEPINALFASQDWKDYDNGNFDEETLQEKRRAFGLPPDVFKQVFNFFLQSLKPKRETIELVKLLHQLGYEQYYLSNGARTYVKYINSEEYFKNEHFNLNELFADNQILLSADVLVSKPAPEIFQKANDKFKLHGKKVIFIDDLLKNIQAATQSVGWLGIQFTTIENVKSQLAEYGVAIPVAKSMLTPS